MDRRDAARSFCWARVTVALVAAVSTALAGLSASAALGQAPNKLIVSFDEDVSQGQIEEVVDGAEADQLQDLEAIDGAVVRPQDGESLAAVARRLEQSANVEYVERDSFVRLAKTPDDPLFAVQFGLNGAAKADVGAARAWDIRTRCSKVAVLDTGVDTDHPELASNLWKNPKESSNGRDDDGNGYVDDIYGADAVDRYGSGEDRNGHGTHVAGIIAGRGNNEKGLSGVCWRAKVMSVRFMNANGVGTVSGSIAALDYAVNKGAKVVNASFSSAQYSQALKDAIKRAKDKGVLVVAAAGNASANIDYYPAYPASYQLNNIITVAASTWSDDLASFSSYGNSSVDLAAPGEQILSTYPGNYYAVMSGTSMASPMVAAAAALLMAKDPDASYSKIRKALRKYGDKPKGLKGKVTYGVRLDLYKSMKKVG